jgi:hypothetical protein
LKEQRSNGEFHRADPGWRKRMQWLLALTVILGVGALFGLRMWLARFEGSDGVANARALVQVLAVLCIALGIVAGAFSAWLFRIASATRAERRWPPASMRTSADVRIRYLTSADALVTQMKAGALALALAALGLAAWGAWLLRSP